MIEPSIWKSNIFGFHHKINEHLRSEGFTVCNDREFNRGIYELTIVHFYGNFTKITVFKQKLILNYKGGWCKDFFFDSNNYESFLTAYQEVIALIEENTK